MASLSTFCSTVARTSRRRACHKGLPLHVSYIVLQVEAESPQCPDRRGSAVLCHFNSAIANQPVKVMQPSACSDGSGGS